MGYTDIMDINFSSPASEVREIYTNVGPGPFILGEYARYFFTDGFEVWDSAVGGTQLTLDVDYEFVQKSDWYTKVSNRAGLSDIYTTIRVLNVAYQTGNIYITYDWAGTSITTDIIEDIWTTDDGLQIQIDALSGGAPVNKTASYVITDIDGVSEIYFLSSTLNMTATLPTLADNLNRIITILNDTEVIKTACTTNSATAVVTMGDTTGLLGGMNVYGCNVNSATTISTIDSPTQITLNVNCNKTEAATATLFFVNTVIVDGEGTETIQELTTIELPRGGDYVKIRARADEWKILEENITAQLILDTYAGYGSAGTENKIVRLTNNREFCGNMFTQNHDSGYSGNTKGIEIGILKNGVYSFGCSFITSSANQPFGLSINSDQRSTSIASINIVNVLTKPQAPSSGVPNAASYAAYFQRGDIVRFQTSGVAASVAGEVLFHCTYLS